MLYDLLLIAVIVLYVVVLVLLALSQKWDDQAELFERWAGILGLVAGVATLVTNVLVVSGPDLFEATFEWGLLLLLAVAVPVSTVVGSILTWLDRRGGVPILVTSSILWLLVCCAGVVVSLRGGL